MSKVIHNVERQIERLESKHRSLSVRVDEIVSKSHWSDDDQQRVNQLKKEKLAAKDALSELRRS